MMREKDAKIWFVDHLSVSRETISGLDTYAELIRKWNPAINLVANSTLPDLWGRHLVDSAQIWPIAGQIHGKWADFGSGGGMPGLIVAILAKEKAPDLRVDLVESDQRKAAFLRQVSIELGLNTQIHAKRAESLPSLKTDFISARALSSLTNLLGIVERHGKPDTIALFPKGRGCDSELTEARKKWTFTAQKTTSLSDPDGIILRIEGVKRA